MDVNFNTANKSAKVGINKIVEEAKSKIEFEIKSLIHDRLSKLKEDLDEKFIQQYTREKAFITNELALLAIEAKNKSMQDFEKCIENDVQEATKTLKRTVTKVIDEEKLGTSVRQALKATAKNLVAEENDKSIRTMTQKMDDYREDIRREKQMAVSKISKTLQEEIKDPSTYREIEKYITLQFGSTE